jgi:hypothetical protein
MQIRPLASDLFDRLAIRFRGIVSSGSNDRNAVKPGGNYLKLILDPITGWTAADITNDPLCSGIFKFDFSNTLQRERTRPSSGATD